MTTHSVPKPGSVSDALAAKPRPNLDAVRAAVAVLNAASDAAYNTGADFNLWAVTTELDNSDVYCPRWRTHVYLDTRGPLKPGETCGGPSTQETEPGWQLIPGTNVLCRAPGAGKLPSGHVPAQDSYSIDGLKLTKAPKVRTV